MEAQEPKDSQVRTFKRVFNLITFVSLGLFVWAMCSAYQRLDIHLILWILIYALFAVYFVMVIKVIRGRSGINRFFTHIFTLHLVPICVAILLFVYLPDAKPSASQNKEQKAELPASYKPLSGRPRDYERHFNDMQDKQKAAAVANGLETFESRAEIEGKYSQLQSSKRLKKIETNANYVVRDLTYSSPYVVPKMAKLLDDIAASLQAKTQSNARFVVTSVLRTKEDIAKLKRVNGNASSDSCHCNATTVDISYVRFGQDGENEQENYLLRLALAQTLHELRKEGRCYVKIERKQYCYHITVR